MSEALERTARPAADSPREDVSDRTSSSVARSSARLEASTRPSTRSDASRACGFPPGASANSTLRRSPIETPRAPRIAIARPTRGAARGGVGGYIVVHGISTDDRLKSSIAPQVLQTPSAPAQRDARGRGRVHLGGRRGTPRCPRTAHLRSRRARSPGAARLGAVADAGWINARTWRVRQVYGDGKVLLDQLREVADLLADGFNASGRSGKDLLTASCRRCAGAAATSSAWWRTSGATGARWWARATSRCCPRAATRKARRASSRMSRRSWVCRRTRTSCTSPGWSSPRPCAGGGSGTRCSAKRRKSPRGSTRDRAASLYTCATKTPPPSVCTAKPGTSPSPTFATARGEATRNGFAKRTRTRRRKRCWTRSR